MQNLTDSVFPDGVAKHPFGGLGEMLYMLTGDMDMVYYSNCFPKYFFDHEHDTLEICDMFVSMNGMVASHADL